MDRETLAKELKKVINSGKMYFGMKQAKKAIKKGEAKVIIVASNAPNAIDAENVPIIKFDGDGFELGALCGKPFSISVVTVVSEGEARLSSMVK